MDRKLFVVLLGSVLASGATAQFTGPGASAPGSTSAKVQTARLGSYVTLTGNIVAHQRGDYFTFRDGSGEVRVEVARAVFNNRKVAPETRVRLVGEVDEGTAGRYLWVKSLELIP